MRGIKVLIELGLEVIDDRLASKSSTIRFAVGNEQVVGVHS